MIAAKITNGGTATERRGYRPKCDQKEITSLNAFPEVWIRGSRGRIAHQGSGVEIPPEIREDALAQLPAGR
jgi:hypothetical protein